MNTPIEQYTAWARQVYKDDKTKLFPMSAERFCLYVKYKNISPTTIPELIQYLAKHPKHGEEWSIKMKEHPSISDFFTTKKTKNQLTIEREPSCVVVEGSKAKGFMIVSNKSITNNYNNTISNSSSNVSNSIESQLNVRMSCCDKVRNETYNTRSTLQKLKSINTKSTKHTESQPVQSHQIPTVKEKVKIAELIAKNKRLSRVLQSKEKEIIHLRKLLKKSKIQVPNRRRECVVVIKQYL